MDLNEIKKVINKDIPSEAKRIRILNIISDDSRSLEYMIKMLAYERDMKKELISEMNLELSTAIVFIDEGKKKLGGLTREVLIERALKFYDKYKTAVMPLIDFTGFK